MLLHFSSFRNILVLTFFLASLSASSQADSKLFIKSDSVYQFYYPANWKVTKSENDLYLKIPKTEGQVQCFVKSNTQNVTDGFANSSIKELATEEERLTKETMPKLLSPGVSIDYRISSFEKINSKEWWLFEFVTNYSGFKYYTRVWKTVHNSKAYSIEFSASDNNFSNNLDKAVSLINSYHFLNKDETVYRKMFPSDKTTASSAGNKTTASTGANVSSEKDQGPVSKPDNSITSIPSTEPIDSLSVTPASTINDKTGEEIKIEGEKNEADLIKACAPAIKRKTEDILEIKLINGKIVSLKNKGGDEDSQRYSFAGCLPSFNAYLFEVMGWEEMSWLMVNKTDGTKTSLVNSPVLSPDRKRLVCTLSGETDSGYGYNYLEIWSFANGKIKNELKLADMNWGAGDAEWLSNSNIKIQALKYDGTEVKKLKPKTVTLLNGKWSVR